VCDNTLFVKATEKGREYMGDAEMAPPYPGAKPHFVIGDRIEDSQWLGD
jgi:TfoX/Sxy family transcriptional regulator of competence genes